jgi:hypothetical protein
MPLSPEWAKLPKRHCDNCGKLYKQVRPRREGEHGFCEDNCRKSFHKHQGAYSKLKGDMQKMVAKEFAIIHAELKELRALWIETESRYVAVSTRFDEQPPKRRIAEAISQSLSPSPVAQRANR